MLRLEILPLEDLAFRKKFVRSSKEKPFVPTEGTYSREELVGILTEEEQVNLDLSKLPLHELQAVEDTSVLVTTSTFATPKVRLTVTSEQLHHLLQEGVSLEGFTEVAASLSVATQKLLQVLTNEPLPLPLVIVVEASDLVAPVKELIQGLRGLGLSRLEVVNLPEGAYTSFLLECMPLYFMPGSNTPLFVWRDNAVIAHGYGISTSRSVISEVTAP